MTIHKINPSSLRFLVAVVALGALCLEASSALPCAGNPMQGRTLVWQDDFDGTALDTTKWGFHQTMTGSDCLYANDDRTVRVADGLLTLTALTSPDPKKRCLLPQGLSTRGKMDFKYGYLEMRAKVPFKHGAWPSFWMTATKALKTCPWTSEIDIFEVFSSSNRVVSNLHKWNWNGETKKTEHVMLPGGEGSGTSKRSYTFGHPERLNEEFHVYGFEWTPDEMSFYVDGHRYTTYSIREKDDYAPGNRVVSGLAGHRDFHNIILNNEVFTPGHGWCPASLELNEADLPIAYQIDWIRLWQKSGEMLRHEAAVGSLARTSEPQLKWTCSRFARVEGTRLVVDVPPDQAREGGIATAEVDLSAFGGRSFSASVRCRGENISKPRNSWNGLKFQFRFRNPSTGAMKYQNTKPRLGSFPDTTVVTSVADAGGKLPSVQLALGLQDSSGKVVFDLSTLKIIDGCVLYPRTNENFRVSYPGRVKSLPQLRGVMLPGGACKEDDFRTLRSWGATLARYQMVRNWGAENSDRDIGEYGRWLKGKLDHLDRDVLPWAEKYGIWIVVDLHVPPGGRSGGDMNMFYDKIYNDAFIACWREIANRFKGRRMIYGYDLINEPQQTDLASCDYWTTQARAARAVREIDPDVTIIIEANGWDSPDAYGYLSPLDLDNVIYEVHMYQPLSFTHQGVIRGNGACAYSDEKRGWNRDCLIRHLKPVRDFQLKHNARIYVGEFSAAAWAPGAERYLADCIALFDEYGWDWSYHAFREWAGWSVEHEGSDKDHLKPSADNPRKRVLLRGLRGEDASDDARHNSTAMNQTTARSVGVGNGGLRLLVLGNSIALHAKAPQIGWTNDWGMAASAKEKDFAHLVAKGLEASLQQAVDLRVCNLADFERNLDGYDIAAQAEKNWTPDAVVIALGENVPDKDVHKFGERLAALGNFYRKLNPGAKIVYRTVFWPNSAKDAQIRKAVRRTPGARLSDITGLGADVENQAGKCFRHSGVAAHPGDLGMRRIAEAILQKLK